MDMKLITLNTWGGRVSQPLFDFLKEKSVDTDIFCLQEIHNHDEMTHEEERSELFSEIASVLPEFKGFFRPYVTDTYGITTFVNNKLPVEDEGDIFIFKERGHRAKDNNPADEGRNLQYAKVNVSGKTITVLSFHGLWNGKGKTDTEDRINQSRLIVEFISKIEGPIILCGDFNLLPDTQSIKILEDAGMVNLVKKFSVTSTRTPLYKWAAVAGGYADYIFVTPDIKVNEFTVLPDVVSDHAPLFLDCDIVSAY